MVFIEDACLSTLYSAELVPLPRRYWLKSLSGLQLGSGSSDALLESKFALLEGGFSGVEDDFQQMKKNMADSGRLGSKPPVQKPTTIYWTS